MKTKLYLLFFLMIGIFFQSCKEDDVNDPTNPIVELETTAEVYAGLNYQIQARVTHELGIQSIQITQLDWDLDKVIDLSETMPTEYDVDYSFKVPADAPSGDITITATSIGGNRTTEIQSVTVEELTYQEMYIIGSGIGYDDNSWYDPSSATKMDLTDIPGVFKVTANFVNDAGGDYGVYFKFLGQRNDYVPVNFGVLPGDQVSSEWGAPWVEGAEDATYQVTGPQSDLNAENIDDSDFIVYYYKPGKYEITLDTENMTVHVLRIGDADNVPQADMYFVGAGYADYPENNWSPAAATPMETLTDGVYKFTAVKINAGAEMKFISQRDWWPGNYGPAENTSVVVGTDMVVVAGEEEVLDPGSFVFDKAGTYDITFNLNELTFKAELVGEAPVFPIAENLYILAGGTQELSDDSWYDPSLGLEMTKVSDGVFETTLNFNDLSEDDWGVYFTFVGQNTGFNPINYGVSGSNDPSDNETFALTAPIANLSSDNIDDLQSYVYYYNKPGEYKITVNANDQTVKVVETTAAVEPTNLYIIGSGIGIDDASWYDPSKGTMMTPTGVDGEYSITTTFADDYDLEQDYGVFFKFVGQNDGNYGPVNYGVTTASDDQIWADFGLPWVNGGDDVTYTLTATQEDLSAENIDDSDFIVYYYLSGEYTITVNTNNMTVRVEKTPEVVEPTNLYIIGSGIGIDDASWYDPSKGTMMTPTGVDGEYSITTTFADDYDLEQDYGVFFKFVGQNDGNYGPVNYGVTTASDDQIWADFGLPWVNGGDDVTYTLTATQEDLSAENIDDSDFIVYYYLSGEYTITVNTNNNTVRVQKTDVQ